MKLASCELLIYPRLLSQLICAEDIVWPSRKLNENRNFMWPKGGKACLISLYTKCFREKSDQLVVSRCKGERRALQQANHVPLREKVEEFFGKHPGALAPLDQDIFVYMWYVYMCQTDVRIPPPKLQDKHESFATQAAQKGRVLSGFCSDASI